MSPSMPFGHRSGMAVPNSFEMTGTCYVTQAQAQGHFP
jgi:hypothetical protein